MPNGAEPAFRFGYNTNGLAHHRPTDALRVLAALGYRGVALTPDVGQLDPYRLDAREVREVRALADELSLALAVEAGARFVLDPFHKHAPNLCDPGAAERGRRVDFYRRCIDLAVDLGAPLVSLWAGAAPGGVTLDPGPTLERALGSRSGDGARVFDRLVEGLGRVLQHAEAAGITVAFEPEPGMFIERPAGYALLRDALQAAGHALALTLDVGHCVVTGDLPVRSVALSYAADLAHVHLADCPPGLHEHRMFGRGGLDLEDALEGLRAADFRGLAAVELSRDAHRGPAAAAEALEHLRRITTIS
ncbi:MAG: sugar phosphate isomerase/epimerase family protein [Planctomycetota bacterium]